MSRYYKKINIDNLDVIQEKVIALVTDDFPWKVQFSKDLTEKLLTIPELRDNLTKLGYDLDDIVLGINLSKTGNVIHLDWGQHDYSLNIPILNCKNSYVNFYTSTVEAVPAATTTNRYYSFKQDTCSLVDRIHVNEPYILNIKEPHNVDSTNNNKRIMLLIRHPDNNKVAELFNS